MKLFAVTEAIGAVTGAEIDPIRLSPQYRTPGAIPIPRLSRTHLPQICDRLGFQAGAEIGVWKAAYSVRFCREAPQMHLLCVDPWASYQAWEDGKHVNPADIDAAHDIARAALHGHNATILRKFSEEAAKDVPDVSLDFVYIDGNHRYDAVNTDLETWVPKVRSGGIVAGHDYRVFTTKPYIQVVPAVNDFIARHRIDPWFLTGVDRTPSYLWVVP